MGIISACTWYGLIINIFFPYVDSIVDSIAAPFLNTARVIQIRNTVNVSVFFSLHPKWVGKTSCARHYHVYPILFYIWASQTDFVILLHITKNPTIYLVTHWISDSLSPTRTINQKKKEKRANHRHLAAGIRLHTQQKKTIWVIFSPKCRKNNQCTTFHHLGIDEGLSLNPDLPQ